VTEGLTPEFEEPHGGDEVAEDADSAPEIDLHDLNQWVEEEDVLLGFTGMLKCMRADGSLVAFQVGTGLNEFEALGLYMKAISELKESLDIDTYWNED